MLILFDVDGTLTPSRGKIDPDFRRWLQEELRHPFRIITGSDPEKTQEQIGLGFWSSCYVYNCAGNHIYDNGREVHRSNFRIPDDLEWWLNGKLIASNWLEHTGRHIEHRVGLCNFSTVGRNATPEQRRAYHEWDQRHGERQSLAMLINHAWPDLEASVAGETGIDIYQRGTGKEQILDGIQEQEPIHFFGDKQAPGGNDHGLAEAILTRKLGQCYNVQDWTQTWQLLKELNDS